MRTTLTVIEADPAGRPGLARIGVAGDVDACDRPELDRLRRAASRALHIRVDLSRLEFAGAALLGWLAVLRRDAIARGGSLRLGALPRRVARLRALLGEETSRDEVADAADRRPD